MSSQCLPLSLALKLPICHNCLLYNLFQPLVYDGQWYSLSLPRDCIYSRKGEKINIFVLEKNVLLKVSAIKELFHNSTLFPHYLGQVHF